MGQLMRRHWMPVCLTEEVPEPDGAPVKARILGEDLVVFRDTDGRVGVMDEYCPHRRASLVFGRNEDCGLRCLYHGWKMDVEGNVLEMVSEPAASGMAQKVKHLAYPTQEWGGFVWAYMGPARRQRAGVRAAGLGADSRRARHDRQGDPAVQLGADARRRDRLGAQLQPAFVRHGAGTRGDGAKATDTQWLRPSTDKAPRLQVERTPYGFRYAALRRPIKNAAHPRLRAHDRVRRARPRC